MMTRSVGLKSVAAVLVFLFLFTGLSLADDRHGHGYSADAWLGVSLKDTPKGVVVEEVVEYGPADDAGLKVGDVIRKIGGKAVDDPEDVVKVVRALSAGDEVPIDVARDGRQLSFNVKLEKAPMRYARGYAGGYSSCPDGDRYPCPMGMDCPMGNSMMGMMDGGSIMGGPMMGMQGAYGYGKMFGRVIDDLDLTDDQEAKYSELVADYKKRMIKSASEIKVAKVELGELSSADAINLDKLRAKIKEITEKKAEMMFQRYKMYEDVKRMLTPEQLKKLKNMMKRGGMGMMGSSSEYDSDDMTYSHDD